MHTLLRRWFVVVALFITCFASRTASAQTAPRLDYTVAVADASRHMFHLKTQISNIPGKTVDISLPAWTPGWYTIQPYASNVIRLQANANGKRLEMHAVDKQTYRIETEGNRALTVDYDYYANNLAVNGAELSEKRGFFVGTNLFFYVPGHTLDTPSTVTFQIPNTWRIATGMKRGEQNNVFQARNFDNLVDCPVVMGDFDDFQTAALGKTIHIVIDPKGQVNAENQAKLKDYVSRVIESEGKMMGGLPYEEYWVLYVTGGGGGALEHENSTNVMLPAFPSDVLGVVGTTAHEHFHAWNVKRLRPAALWPYDYSKEQYTRELWFAEGFTNYYGALHRRRAGVMSTDEYLRSLATKIGRLQLSEPRTWVSIADSSTVTWLTYSGVSGGFANFTVDYYNKGELVGLLLDLEIRGASANRKSLDDVLRFMFDNFYKKNKGYTVEDIERVASEVAGRSFKEFFGKYVTGTDELDYNAALQHAGLRLVDGRVVDAENVTNQQRALRKSWLNE
jgi:predicted metalloprotease with PDZ domain